MRGGNEKKIRNATVLAAFNDLCCILLPAQYIRDVLLHVNSRSRQEDGFKVNEQRPNSENIELQLPVTRYKVCVEEDDELSRDATQCKIPQCVDLCKGHDDKVLLQPDPPPWQARCPADSVLCVLYATQASAVMEAVPQIDATAKPRREQLLQSDLLKNDEDTSSVEYVRKTSPWASTTILVSLVIVPTIISRSINTVIVLPCTTSPRPFLIMVAAPTAVTTVVAVPVTSASKYLPKQKSTKQATTESCRCSQEHLPIVSSEDPRNELAVVDAFQLVKSNQPWQDVLLVLTLKGCGALLRVVVPLPSLEALMDFDSAAIVAAASATFTHQEVRLGRRTAPELDE
eukprot:SM000244S08547  [mRNA]  locus=s244:59139:65119:+ [translate_table: standard]